MGINIKSSEEVKKLRTANQIVADTLNLIMRNIVPGVSTKELDMLADDYVKQHSVLPAFKGYKGYPSCLCVSINDQVVHGIPSDNIVIENEDIVSVDFGVNYKGYFGDAAVTVIAGTTNNLEKKKLLKITAQSLKDGIAQARSGNRISDISEAIQNCAEANGFYVVKKFVGHGIGKKLHEPPEIPNYKRSGANPRILPGMVFAIEPMVNVGTSDVKVLNDGWTVVTVDKSYSAHFEHSILVTDGEPEILSVGINYNSF